MIELLYKLEDAIQIQKQIDKLKQLYNDFFDN